MKILVTSDWQADYENLDLCKAAAEEILRLKYELGFKVLVLAGDLKHAYNPVDVRVINFWMRTIAKWRHHGLDVFVDLGNHDRVGMHVDKQNWLPVLRKAGALCFDEPAFAPGLAFLPFRQQSVLLKREAADLAALQKGNNILIFHCDLKNARYNVLSRSESELTVQDLHPEKYLFCIGGHLHFQHKVVDNVWYVGSPFATDWGEANQKKGYLFVDTEKRVLKRIPSKSPGWYDPSWPGFEEAKPESWKNAKVRIKVPCNGVQHVRETLERAKKEAIRKYAGADIVVIPEFREEDRASTGGIKLSFPDEKKIRVYVEQTIPDELRKYGKAVRRFLLESLSSVGGLQREHGELRFSKVRADNFLSFERLEYEFVPGLHVIAGENLDWKGRSNGSGKSSYLQPVAVAITGQTFKGQKHDRWVRRDANKKEVASVRVWFKDAQDRACKVLRSRQPVDLWLKVAGHTEESGNRPEHTQKLIEQVTGYTWETLSNAIYIDQAKSHLMLTGTEGERKGFLAKLQNLERFERAVKAIGVQKNEFEGRYESVSLQLQSVSTEENNLLGTIHDAERILAVNRSAGASLKKASAAFAAKRDELKAWDEKAEKEVQRLTEAQEVIRSADKDIIKLRTQREERWAILQERLDRFERLEGTCPTCEQPIDGKQIKKAIPEIKKAMDEICDHFAVYSKTANRNKKALFSLRAEETKWFRNWELEHEVNKLRQTWQEKKSEMEQFQKQQELIDKLQKRVNACSVKGGQLTQQKNKIGKWLKVLKYAHTVFQRNGLPAYLNQQICPELNQAAEEYSELFSQSEIQVRFAVDEEGRLDVQVINLHGGEDVDDQSEGEMRIASLITSFAIRSIAPKTNILILDEPGHGLDAVSARTFARGIRKVVNRFETILLTTHNPAILSELADVRLVTIKKKNRVSEVVQ